MLKFCYFEIFIMLIQDTVGPQEEIFLLDGKRVDLDLTVCLSLPSWFSLRSS